MEFKSLAAAIGMSEGNLHRCVRENKIQALDLEKISSVLNVSITEFFDEDISSVRTEGNFSPVAGKGNVMQNIGADLEKVCTHTNNSEAILLERVNSLESILKEKDERIIELKERIAEMSLLLNKLHLS